MILLVSYGGGHIAIISRLYEFLLSRNHSVKILPLTTATIFCESKKYDYLKINDFVDYNLLNDKEFQFIKKISYENHNEDIGLDYAHTKAYYTIGLYPLIKKYGINKTKKLYLKNKRLCFSYIDFAEKMIKKIKPELVITTNVPRMELSFRQAAFKSNIRVFSIDDLDGYYGKQNKSHFSHKIFVDNKNAKNNLLKDGYDGEIIISGNPVFDDIIKLSKNKNRIITENLLIILQPGIRNLKNKIVENFDDKFYINLFSNLDKINFFSNFNKISVRFHPSMKKEVFWNNDKIKIDNKKNIHDSLTENGSVFGFSSTAIKESYLLGNYIYRLKFDDNYYSIDVPAIGTIDFDGNCKFYDDPVIIDNFNKKELAIDIIYNHILYEIHDN